MIFFPVYTLVVDPACVILVMPVLKFWDMNRLKYICWSRSLIESRTRNNFFRNHFIPSGMAPRLSSHSSKPASA